MEFRVLGRLEVVDDGRAVPVERQRARAVLAFLLLHANEPVSAELLIDEVWGPEPPKSAAASLQNYVSHLRKALGRDVLVTAAGGYLLRVDPERFDLARFERLVADARRVPDPHDRAETLRAALALWRGAPLEDLQFESFAQQAIRRLEEQRFEALEDRIDADLACGRGAELVGELEVLIEQQPLRERSRGQLMRALYAAGRQADALDAYRDARRMLRDELGLDPSDELRDLEQAILRHDASLGGEAPPEAPRPDSRRTVSILFCDLVESTRLARELDPEAYRALMTRYLDAVRRPIEAHGGTVEKFIGDAVMAVFGAPELHEDDALRAVRAAVEARDAVAELADVAEAEWDVRLAVRVAVNSGEVVVVSMPGKDLHVTGAAVSVASHIEEQAQPGDVLLGEETHRILAHAVRAEPIELAEDLLAWRLEDLSSDVPQLIRRDDAPLVGRQKELRRLLAAFDAARAERRCRVVTVVGEAGIGKTRLARELVASVQDDAQLLVGRCVSYGEGATYLPLAEIVRQAAPEPTAAGIATLLAGEEDGEQIAQRVAELTGLAEGPAAPGEAFWAVRRFVEALARERPVLLALDDVHWAEPTLLDLVEYLGEWAEGPILILCLARRDLLEARPAWGGPTSTGFVVELEPLPAHESAELLAKLADEPLPEETLERIVEQSGGNPLFAEQLLALVQEAPDVDVGAAPPSVEALIASRLDRLDVRELETIRRASVVGRRFTRAELEDLAVGEPVEPHLRELEQRRLVRPTPDGNFYRFHHVLVRDVAYRGIPKAGRADLHERAAESLDRRDGADELVGYHFEQAYRYLTELARPDKHAQELAVAGGERLGHAGVRAWKRSDTPAAVNLLGRATELLPRQLERRRELLCELGLALRTSGDLPAAEAVLAEAMDESIAAKDKRLELRAAIERANVRTYRHPETAPELIEVASKAIPALEKLRDHRSLGRAWFVVGIAKGSFQCDYAASEEAASKALEHYRKAGWSPGVALNGLASALYYGPRPVDEAVGRCIELLEQHRGDRASEANILVHAGGLDAMRGRFEHARNLVAEAEAKYLELGQTFHAVDTCGFIAAAIDMLAANPEAAEVRLRRAAEALLEAGETAVLSTRAAQLADALYVLSRYDEASHWVGVGDDHAAPADLDAQMRVRSVAAKLHARLGDVTDAEDAARAAVALSEQTDALNDRAQVLLDLAEVLRLAGRQEESLESTASAIALYERKGNTVAADRARSLLSGTLVA
jgi:DNA-binding SARP family transcriptional activator/tetratricopeptide (TPR) repeat protein